MTEHRWSGWPGAVCLDCGADDQREICLADHPEHSVECTGCELCRTAPCPVTKWTYAEEVAKLRAQNAELVKVLEELATEKCRRCHGKGERLQYCSRCDDSGDDHECPGYEECDVCNGTGSSDNARKAKAALAAHKEG